MAPKTTLWPRDEHTIGKHLVLRAYLNAWFPIIGRTSERIVFYDGFAGPGEYEGGDEGSPIIALRALCEHHDQPNFAQTQVFYRFIEARRDRYEHLNCLIDSWRPSLPVSARGRVEVLHDTFNDRMTSILNTLDERNEHLPPSLVMIDPFGIKGIPLATIARIFQHRRTEVYISVMCDFISRFRGTPEFEGHLDELFGCTDWRDGIGIQDSLRRQDFFLGLYERQLREAGAQQVVRFDLYRGARRIYSIFFGSQHWLGADKMKGAIWGVAPFGDFAFRAGQGGQLTLGLAPAQADFAPLREQILGHFGAMDDVSVEEVEEFVGSDATNYTTSHLRRRALVPMERAEELQVLQSTRQRRGAFPAGTRMRFIPPP